MQVTIHVPDWMANDFAQDVEGKTFNSEVVERAVLAYYMALYDPASGQRTKAYLDGSF